VETQAVDVKASFLLGVGGGKSIDIAKLAAMHLDMPFISVRLPPRMMVLFHREHP